MQDSDSVHSPSPTQAPAGGLTSAEQLIWAGQRLDPASPMYNMAIAVDLKGLVEIDALRRAFQLLVDEDNVLRTVFREEAGRPRRVVLQALEAHLEVIDLPEPDVDDAEVMRVLEERTRVLLPLGEPLFDVCVVRRGPDRSILYFNQHHIVTDAASAGVLYRRWGQLYETLVDGSGEPRQAYPRFSDYVAHEHALRTSPQLARALEYWEQTKTESTVTASYYGGEAGGPGHTHRVRVGLGKERADALARLAGQKPFRALTREQSRYLVFATLTLAWLHRVCDRPNVSFGAPWHNRPTIDFREMLGLFIELYPLRVTVDPEETLSSLASKVAAATMRTIRHVVPGASAGSGARGYSAVLNYITASLGDFAGIPAEANWIHSGFGDPDHAVRLQVHDFDAGGEPTLDFDLADDVFDESAREWTVAHFLALFDALAEDPDQPIRSIELGSWAEAARYVPVGETHDAPPTVLRGLWRSAIAHPDSVAIVEEESETTYAEMAARTRNLAAGLKTLGVGRGDAVGICMDRSATMVITVLGVLEVGAAYVPLDPEHPDARLSALLDDAGVALVLADQAHVSRGEAWSVRVLTFESATKGQDGSAPAQTMEAEEPAADDLAYILYTSGSTGRPKGVEITHGALADYTDWARRTYAPDGPVRFPLFTSPAFDLTITSIFTPLLSGGAIVIYSGEPGRSGLLVRRVFEDDAVDVVKLTPSHLALIRDMDLVDSRVRRLIVGGEDLRSAAAKRVHEAFGGRVAIFNEYGPTEATVGCMVHRYDPALDTGPSVPIGAPAGNMHVHVLGRDGRPVPRGTRGEISVSGPRLARGYRGRADLTETAFVLDLESPFGRTYRTGDIGRWSASGPLDFLGRLDDQVKVRGTRLELGEVEAALAAHPQVLESAARLVKAAPHSSDHCRVCGLEASHPEAHLDEQQICQVCRRFEDEKERVAGYFGNMDQLGDLLASARETATGPNDTLMLYSGGKDSTYALCRIVEMGSRPLVFTLDNGFISEQAKTNVRRVVDQLGLELVVGQPPSMPEIFADSLSRFSNVCNGCFKTIYTLAMNLASERGIGALVTGLSRGQIFETRLADLYRRGIYDPADVDRTILEARKAYHRMDDAVSRSLDVEIFRDDNALDRIQFIDFYRYCDVPLEELLGYVAEHTPWIRPPDTGRSTNCLINEAGIFVHQAERGFHSYALPYSWDVRLGHKERDAALEELDDDLDPAAIRRMLDQVGYREREAPPAAARLLAYYTAHSEVPVPELRRFLSDTLPTEAIPSGFVRLDEMPLTPNGKLDRNGLPQPADERPLLEGVFVAPRTAAEESLVQVWSEVLGLTSLGVEDDFFELGGDSMHCIQIVALARDRGLSFAPRDLFAHPTVAGLARVAETVEPGVGEVTAPAPATVSMEEIEELGREFGA